MTVATELTLLDNRLKSICREMGVAMMRTVYPPVFNEGFDFIGDVLTMRADGCLEIQIGEER